MKNLAMCQAVGKTILPISELLYKSAFISCVVSFDGGALEAAFVQNEGSDNMLVEIIAHGSHVADMNVEDAKKAMQRFVDLVKENFDNGEYTDDIDIAISSANM